MTIVYFYFIRESLSDSQKYKFVDDLLLLEIVNLVSIGISSYNIKSHVPSDIGPDQHYVPSENLKSQEYLNNISEWTNSKKMKLNAEKTSVMIFNETEKYQFTTRLCLNEAILEILEDTKLLGIIISSDLSWYKNTKMLVSKAYKRIILLKKLYEFN